ncbi:PLP-dependent aminotransferase family protein [Modicisalibacter coralii]|uniref:MocR-like pyridoxine biosynthesis transcription factor PdxR n=1 Tax=Modicisalibacter coralii TaxID=2304602 RepID=UPI00100AD109|nr:PLP-dependent aminotransferase family protein [Halomonas coralii]
MSNRHLEPDRRQTVPLYRQLYQRFRESIATGRLRPDDRVPSVRSLASELNLSRGTVELAYQLLVSEGYFLSRGAAGTFVSPALAMEQTADLVERRDVAVSTPGVEPRSPLPFQLGLPALDAFPGKLWSRLTTRRLRRRNAAQLGYPDPRGMRALREALATYLGVSRGIDCHAHQIIITAGYRDALSVICRTLLRPGDRGWFEEPGYFMARDMLQAAGMSLVPIDVDAEGLDIAAGRRRAEDARFAVVTPSHQSPMGVTLTLPRRLALLEWAADNQAWIIEDDYDSEFRYRGRPLPALKSLDRRGRVLYTGTFSKVLFPDLRLAYLVVPEAEVERFCHTLVAFGHGCPELPQAVVADFMSEGHFSRHLKRMRALYAERRDCLRRALETRLAARLRVDLPAGGMQLLARLIDDDDDVRLAARAQRRGLAVKALSDWYLGQAASPGLLLGFTNVQDADEAERLVGRLQGVWRG